MKTHRIVLATQNAGKVRELTELFAQSRAGHGMEVLGLKAFPDIADIEETGTTFEENALLKARCVTKATGLVSVADDSGLVVDCLSGAPGVHSARYADDWQALPGESRDARNIRKLLHTLEDVPPRDRACRFVSCIAAVKPDGAEMTVAGVWEGVALESPRGENGFGYDPVFFDPTCGKSAAELSGEEKNARSHRGKALRALLGRWADFFEPDRR
ncbi:MAG: RdgB/HAM1 family non-canonical purine NTP pyrophosphatase [Desulfovibrio sp.]|jgi:XTP/dITP diphosphohydrolase|nr:RdgB/HAM1 family non-canonical purine NTP pyrophosphatase [Desulfovibrio sp.]